MCMVNDHCTREHYLNAWYAQHEHALPGNREQREMYKQCLENFLCSTEINSADDLVMQRANFKRDIRHFPRDAQPLLMSAFFAMYGIPREIEHLLPDVVVHEQDTN